MGCWYYYNPLQGVLNFQRGFKPQDTDIILTSYPKSGTTWLRALTVTLLERAKNHSSSSSHDEHPLLCDNPHRIVPFLEVDVFLESSSPNLAKFSASPRLFSTHMPLHAMQENLNPSPCKIVYVCRNVKDTLISWWFFTCAVHKIEPIRSILESIYVRRVLQWSYILWTFLGPYLGLLEKKLGRSHTCPLHEVWGNENGAS
ncbi:hypothetical protein F2Q70_00001191 [Brassica cretica]|uniref:Sulfotransferase n=1 Tax=Brassica cretica TaxID=69181 RepID=A0A8S9IYF2_BRACR|nr:hypothetical protein F2Q70_00001191 [Brassica cretica]